MRSSRWRAIVCLWRMGCTLPYDIYTSMIHIFSSWLPINFSLCFKGTPQHLTKVITNIQMLILMASKPFNLLSCGTRSRDSFLGNIWLRNMCSISPSVFFYLVPEKSPFSLWGIFSGSMHIHELPIFWAYRESAQFLASITLNSVWVFLIRDLPALPHAARRRQKDNFGMTGVACGLLLHRNAEHSLHCKVARWRCSKNPFI